MENLLVPTEVQHVVTSGPQKSQQIPQSLNPSNPPMTRTTKTGKVQELLQPQGPKIADLIRRNARQTRFDAKKVTQLV